MDIVYVKDLLIDARIGIYPWEKAISQKIRINLEMAWDNRIPAVSKQIDDALNYKTATTLVTELVAQQHYDLVETLAEEIANTLITKMRIPWIRVAVGKPYAVKGTSEVGVRIERGTP